MDLHVLTPMHKLLWLWRLITVRFVRPYFALLLRWCNSEVPCLFAVYHRETLCIGPHKDRNLLQDFPIIWQSAASESWKAVQVCPTVWDLFTMNDSESDHLVASILQQVSTMKILLYALVGYLAAIPFTRLRSSSRSCQWLRWLPWREYYYCTQNHSHGESALMKRVPGNIILVEARHQLEIPEVLLIFAIVGTVF
jgi:hypothetical protein